MRKTIAICIPCFNEEDNINKLYERLNNTLSKKTDFDYKIIFADNCSTDATVELINNLIKKDKRIGLIKNVSNFGFVRSSANALLAPDADANIFLMADLQDPPELVLDLIEEWSLGQKQVIFATRKSSRENKILFLCKKLYYFILSWLSNYPMVRDTTGFGIYDKVVIQALRQSIDSYPYIKGLVCAIGFNWGTINYVSADRKGGSSSAKLSFLIDFGVLGIVTSSRKPMRIITITGTLIGIFSFFLSSIVLFTKLIYWDSFQFGIAMLSISLLFLSGMILFALGIIGEYVGFINQRALKLPLVIESERINVNNEYLN